MYSVAKEPLGDFSPLPSTSRSWQGVLETDSFSGKGKSSSDKTDLQHVTGQVPRISSATPGSQICLFPPQAGGQGERTHLPLEDRPQTVGAVRSSSQNMSPALEGREGRLGSVLRKPLPALGVWFLVPVSPHEHARRHAAQSSDTPLLRPHEKHNGNTSLGGW